MTRDGDIPTIFNPLNNRTRAPSVVVTEEGVANGPFAHADSIVSQQETFGEPLSLQTPPTSLGGRLKTCSESFCSKSAQKVKSFFIFISKYKPFNIQIIVLFIKLSVVTKVV